MRDVLDTSSQILPEIGRYRHDKYTDNPELIDEFIDLCTTIFTFLPSWNDKKIIGYLQENHQNNLLIDFEDKLIRVIGERGKHIVLENQYCSHR